MLQANLQCSKGLPLLGVAQQRTPHPQHLLHTAAACLAGHALNLELQLDRVFCNCRGSPQAAQYSRGADQQALARGSHLQQRPVKLLQSLIASVRC
jgi:hypothetical protein